SFFSLMIISYIVDVYRDKLSCEHDFTVVALYISFFPHIVSGPITKARDIMGQFKKINPINKKEVYYGIQIFVTGAFKKVLIADRLAVCSNAIYSNPMEYSGLSLLLGIICYTVQLYCDFSGYTDMATGIATILGFKLAANFDLPYIAKNPTETWKRWHISLSSWLQEYVYISLGGNRKGRLRQYINLMLTMVVGGLWHGFSMTYVMWGIQCGLGLCVHKIYKEITRDKPGSKNLFADFLRILFTYLYFTMGTVIFRAGSLRDAFVIFKRILSLAQGVEYYYTYFFVFFALMIIAYSVAAVKNQGHGFYVNLNLEGFWQRVVLIFVILLTVIYGYFGNNVFIYAQF
ncbi:MAG: hypothetical protein K6E98_03800, partial [Lachnospiraceae bacterium]|nr:hypothetical protein [Lachnospiraceae bacterium]